MATNREELIERACRAQELAADAYYWQATAMAASQPQVACEWQAIAARAADHAAADVTRLHRAPADWLELEA
jgi:hypothetical protein